MNKFLKLLLIALVAAVLPGCGSEKTNSSKTTTETAAEKAAREAAEKEAAADEVNPDFATFFKLLADKKPVVIEIDGPIGLPGKGGIAAGAPLISSFPVGAKVTFAAGSDLTKVGSFKISDPAALNTFQAVGGGASVGANVDLAAAELAQFALTVVKNGNVPSVTVLTPNNYGKGLVNAAPAVATNAGFGDTQTQRQFKLNLVKKFTGTDSAQNGDAQLDFTIEGKTYSVPVKVAIG